LNKILHEVDKTLVYASITYAVNFITLRTNKRSFKCWAMFSYFRYSLLVYGPQNGILRILPQFVQFTAIYIFSRVQ
jgi:hypothetical protein